MAHSPIPASLLEGICYEDASGDVKVQVISADKNLEEEYHVHSRVVNWYSNCFIQAAQSRQDVVILIVPSGMKASDFRRFFQIMYSSPVLIQPSQCMEAVILAHQLKCPYLLDKSMMLLSMIPWERGYEKMLLTLQEQGVELSVDLVERLAPLPESGMKSLFEELCRSCDFSCEAAREVLWQSRGWRFCSAFDEALHGEVRSLLGGVRADGPKLLGIAVLASRTQMFHLDPDLLQYLFTRLSVNLELPANIHEFLKTISALLASLSVGGMVLHNSQRCNFCIRLLNVLMSIEKKTLQEQFSNESGLLRVIQNHLIKLVGSLPHSYRKQVLVEWMKRYSNIRWPNLVSLVHDYTS